MIPLMRFFRFMALTAGLVALLPFAASAQSVTLGTTWMVPENEDVAATDLQAMYDAGLRAVRTQTLSSHRLFALADSLGMDIYQDLPVAFLPATRLADTLAAARMWLVDRIHYARTYRSARNVGLATLVDTSDPTACQYFESLRQTADQAGGDAVLTYYTTRFTDADMCSDHVHTVLVDASDLPVDAIRQMLDETVRLPGTRRGFGAIGTWVNLDLDNRGLRNTRSPESQARYLEDVLRVVMLSEASPPSPVFIHRWRDPAEQIDAYGDLVQRRYGLHNSAGGPRPAFDIVAGFATGAQTVFAFPAGRTPGGRWQWMVVLSWIGFGILAVVFATSPRMRHMVPRYFLSHGFYREAVSSGRETLPQETVAILLNVSLGVGMLLSTLLHELANEPVFQVARNWVRADVRVFVGAVLDQPWTLTIILGSLYALTNLGWTSSLSFLSKRGKTLLPSQVLMLVVWAQWPLVLLLFVSPAIAGANPEYRLPISAAVVGLAAAVLVAAILRTCIDYLDITRTPPGLVVVGILLHPLLLSIVAAAVVAYRFSHETLFLWHLLTRT